MQKCHLTIRTTADGQASEIAREGEMELYACGAKLSYREDDALITMLFDGERVKIDREGDYVLRLLLVRNRLQKGALGFGGAEGEVETFAHKIAYAVTEKALTAQLHYDLVFGAEKQQMLLHISAHFDNT